MDPSKISERTRRQLEGLPPEKRAGAEAAVARTQTREFRARVVADREALDREYRATGRIATVGESVPAADLDHVRAFLTRLRREREARGLSLADVAERTGIDKAALSRLENAQVVNPTITTLARYARALGKRIALSLEEPSPQGVDSMAMKVELDSIRRDEPQAVPRLERINAMLADELGAGAALTSATWAVGRDPKGRPLFTVALRDAWGDASASFAPDQIERPERLRDALRRLRGELLRRAAT
jgi:transcriptional regulator with XRE-family HTH domain